MTKYECCSWNLSLVSSSTYRSSFMFNVSEFWRQFGKKTTVWCWRSCQQDFMLVLIPTSSLGQACWAYRFIALNICSYTDSQPLIITVPHIFNNNQIFSTRDTHSALQSPVIVILLLQIRNSTMEDIRNEWREAERGIIWNQVKVNELLSPWNCKS